MQFLRNTKYEKNTNQKITNTKCKKYEPKISKVQNTKKTHKFKNEPESQPHVHFDKQEPTCKITAKPTCCIFQTLQFRYCIFELYFYFFTEDPSVANADCSKLTHSQASSYIQD